MVGVFFTGGLDSTYLVYSLLEEGRDVILFYVNLNNNDSQRFAEKLAIKKLINQFEIDYPNRKIQYKEIGDILINYSQYLEVDNRVDYSYNQLIQASVWILFTTFVNIVDEIHFGYVMNDDAISYLRDFKKIHKSYQRLMTEGKKSKLKYPLTKMSKDDIKKFLPTKYKELISYCDMPKIRFTLKTNQIRIIPCNECASCQRMNF